LEDELGNGILLAKPVLVRAMLNTFYLFIFNFSTKGWITSSILCDYLISVLEDELKVE
jgi:hypothetical protein